MKRFAFLCLIVMLFGFLLVLPTPSAEAGGYGYGYGVPLGYNVSYGYVNYWDGLYHWHSAGYGTDGLYYPAGNYAWINGQWYLQGVGFNAGINKNAGYANGVTYTPGWKNKLLDIAATRDKVEGNLRTQALDQKAFLQATEALGLKGNFGWQNYGIHPGFPYNASGVHFGAGGYASTTPAASLGLGNYGASSNTVYGYTYNTVKDVYGDTNLTALYQQSSRLAENAQNLAGQATQGFQDTVSKEGQNRARVAEILAQAQAAKVALDAAKPQASSHTETKSQLTVTGTGTQAGPAPVVGPGVPVGAAAPGANLGAWATLATNKCASCHSAKTPGGAKGKFDVAAFPSMSAEQKKSVIELLVTSDATHRMPKSEDGKEGTPLTLDEVKLFINN